MSVLCQQEKENKRQLSTMIFSKKYQSKKCQEVKSQESLKVYYFVSVNFLICFFLELFQRAIDNESTPKSSPKMKRRKSVDSKINQQIDVLVSGGFDLRNIKISNII